MITKDIVLYFRNRFYAMITVMGLVFYAVIYFLLPSNVDEEIDLGIYATELPTSFELIGSQEGINLVSLESEEALIEAINSGSYQAGVVLPDDFRQKIITGEKPEVILYFPSDSLTEVKTAITEVIEELVFLEAGQTLPVIFQTEILGPDMLGNQVPIRDRLVPMLVVALILFEMMGVTVLITGEIEVGTFKALLVTPMNVNEFFVSKLAMGTMLAFSQAVILMLVIGGFNTQPLIIITALLLGSILVTGTGFLLASFSKDLMSAMGWGFVAFLVFAVPAFGIVVPGTVTGWAQIIPTYYLSNSIFQAANYGAGWGDVAGDLLILCAFILVFVLAGIWTLGRKLR
jgi:ABC-2 type transport system permease protein